MLRNRGLTRRPADTEFSSLTQAATMPTPPPTTSTPSDYRFTVATRDRQLALIQLAGSASWQAVKLFEISAQRMLLELDEPLPAQAPVIIRLELHDGEAGFDCPAIVEWAQMSVRSNWWISCELAEPVCDRLIGRLAHQGHIERRQDPRFPVDMQAQIKFELADFWCVARVVDYSAGGFQALLSARPASLGQRVLLRLVDEDDETTTDLPARVAWCQREGQQTRGGFAFVHRNSYLKFRRVARLANPQTANAQDAQRRAWWQRLSDPLLALFRSLGFGRA